MERVRVGELIAERWRAVPFVSRVSIYAIACITLAYDLAVVASTATDWRAFSSGFSSSIIVEAGILAALGSMIAKQHTAGASADLARSSLRGVLGSLMWQLVLVALTWTVARLVVLIIQAIRLQFEPAAGIADWAVVLPALVSAVWAAPFGALLGLLLHRFRGQVISRITPLFAAILPGTWYVASYMTSDGRGGHRIIEGFGGFLLPPWESLSPVIALGHLIWVATLTMFWIAAVILLATRPRPSMQTAARPVAGLLALVVASALVIGFAPDRPGVPANAMAGAYCTRSAVPVCVWRTVDKELAETFSQGVGAAFAGLDGAPGIPRAISQPNIPIRGSGGHVYEILNVPRGPNARSFTIGAAPIDSLGCDLYETVSSNDDRSTLVGWLFLRAGGTVADEIANLPKARQLLKTDTATQLSFARRTLQGLSVTCSL